MSVETDGLVYLGGGIRGNGINWGYVAVDAIGGGLAAHKLLSGQTLGVNDVVEVRAQFEVGDVARVPLIGEAMKKFMPGAAEADAGAVLKLKITGDGNGGIRVAAVDGFVYADMPAPAGIVGTNPGQGFLNATAGFKWTPEGGLESANNDLLKGQITNVFKPPEGAAVGATGWSVVGTTSNDLSQATAAAGLESSSRLAPAVQAAQAVKFVADLGRSLDGVPGAPVVSPITGKSGPYTNTLVGVTQQIVGVPVPALGGAYAGGFLRVQGTVTAIDDNSDEIRVKGGGNLLFKTSVSQLQSVTQNIQQSLHNLPGIGGLIPEPNRPAVSSTQTREPNSRTYQAGDGIGIPGAGNLVYRGVQSDGYHHVASRTTDYRVPAAIGYDKDAIRNWAIAAVANGAIDRTGLYGAAQPVRESTSRAYEVGAGIGIPGAGNLVYRGVQSDGYHHVASRTTDYRVPASVGYDKDAIRSWAIAAVANGAIDRTGLYGTAQPTRESTSKAYDVGDGIGIPGAGNLVYRGVQSDGYYHVASRTTDYRVPASVGYDKDAIRSWAIAAVANGAIARDGLYNSVVAERDRQPATPVVSAPYRTGDYVGTPYGQVVFKGVQDDGYLHVQTRTANYRVPAEHDDSRDAIRSWVIKAIENGGIDRGALYPNRVSAALEDGITVGSSAGERQVVRTSDNRELVVAMKDGSPVVTSEGTEILRLREGTTLAQAAELVASRASPVLGQGVPVADVQTRISSEPGLRNTESPQMTVG
jgi:hypothetical protein